MEEFVSKENLGQHFLIDKMIVEKEISVADLSNKDSVIEIGAGRGFLTEELAKKSKEVLAFEIDEELSDFLDALEKKHDNLKIVYGDALKSSWKGYNKLVSNIPYHLSEAIIMKAIDSGIDEIVLIVGENFKGLIEEDKEKVGIIVNVFFDFKSIMLVSKKNFSPEPKIDSWLIKLKRKWKSSKKERILQNIVTKKGKIKNAIVNSLVNEGMTKNQAREIIKKMNLNEYTLNKLVASLTGMVLGQVRNLINQQ